MKSPTAKTSDSRLHAYFCKYARYNPRTGCDEWRYTILWGPRHLHAADTAALFQQFVASVRGVQATSR